MRHFIRHVFFLGAAVAASIWASSQQWARHATHGKPAQAAIAIYGVFFAIDLAISLRLRAKARKSKAAAPRYTLPYAAPARRK
jgi:hypothetical protein